MRMAMPYMKTLVMCLGKLVSNGYTDDFKATDDGLESMKTHRAYAPTEINIINFFRFEGFNDPGDNAVVYVIETSDGTKGTLIDGYGTYSDIKVKKIINAVEDIHRK